MMGEGQRGEHVLVPTRSVGTRTDRKTCAGAFTLHEEFFPARDGLQLFQRRWLPSGEPRAEVLVVHGLIEHGGRYAPTAETLARRGYAVTAMDLRGHGRSEGLRCWVRAFDEYLDDLDVFFDRVARSSEGKPVFLLGHSLGGLIAAWWCIHRQPQLRGLILSGPVLQVCHRLFPWLRHLAGVGSVLFPRLRLLRWAAGIFRATRRSSASFVTIRWCFMAVFPCGPGRKSSASGAWPCRARKSSARRC